jgi:ATP-dependent DNA ligase
MKKFDNLYARDSKGKIRSFELEIKEVLVENSLNLDSYDIVRTTGLINGKKVEHITKVTKGKAKRTLLEQAELVATSKYNKKLDEGYVSLTSLNFPEDLGNLNISFYEWLDDKLPKYNTDASGNVKPMLAQPYKNQVLAGNFMQPKLNGVRCLMFVKDGELKAVSRQGKSYNVATRFIREQIEDYMLENPSIILDGELYIHGTPLQEISGWVRKQEPIVDHKYLEYHVYDIAMEEEQLDRLILLDKVMDTIGPGAFLTRKVTTIMLHEEENLQKYHRLFVSQGYEGSIIRDSKGIYQFGTRSKSLIKIKDFIDEEFEILGCELGERGTEDLVFLCKQEEGKTFKVKPKGNRAIKEDYYNNIDSLVGEKLTVRYFERTQDNIPHHGVGLTIRNYE